MRTLYHISRVIPQRLRGFGRSDGQVLVLFAFGLIAFCGLVAMSIDVGRYVWARTQMQAAVDAAALAAVQSLPSTTGAINQGTQYYQDNAEFIINADPGASTPTITFPGDRKVVVRGDAEIPTWFARIFGIDHWNVSAEGTGETVVLDTMIVMDRSGSMCFTTNGSHLSSSYGTWNARFRLQGTVNATDTTLDVIIDSGAGALSNVAYVGQEFRVRVRRSSSNSTMETETMRITALLSGNRIRVSRDIGSDISGSGGGYLPSGSSTAARPRPYGSSCQAVGPSGTYEPWNTVNHAASFFPTKLSQGYDRVGYVQYDFNARMHTTLSTQLSSVRTSIQNAPEPTSGNTNIANGLGVANAQLVSNGRTTADYVIVLVTDGVANQRCTGSDQSENCSNTSANESTANSRALAQADYAAENGIKIYTIGFGPPSNFNPSLLQQIAERTGGIYFAAPNEAGLNAAFDEIASIIRVRLTQ